MAKEKNSFNFDANSLQKFTVQFLGHYVSIDGTTLEVGQVSTEILNLSKEIRQALQDASSRFANFLQEKFGNLNIKKDRALANELQEHVNQVQDILFQIPPYSYMRLDKELARTVWASIYEMDPDDFQQMFLTGTPQNAAVRNYINSIMNALPEIVEFREKVHAMLDVYFEPLPKRSAAAYAEGAHAYIEAGQMLDDLDPLLQGRSVFKLEQTRRAMVDYTPMPNPGEPEEFIIAERMVFHTIAEFLHMDLFRALMNGNAPRRCHNCGTYFLLTKGYNTCYCNSIAPGETERTCRKVGAHKKETAKKGKSPIELLYNRVYKKLTARKNRGVLSLDEWNQLIAQGQEYKDKANRGEIDEIELCKIYDGM